MNQGRSKTNRLWTPRGSSPRSIAVIERGDSAEDRPGVPFGFARELSEPPAEAESNGWQEYADALAGTR